MASGAAGFTQHPLGGNDGKLRQRIQQACKNCGTKRVKCDGALPCSTCVRTQEECSYGMPKKRGPPKGSTRAPPKAARSTVDWQPQSLRGPGDQHDSPIPPNSRETPSSSSSRTDSSAPTPHPFHSQPQTYSHLMGSRPRSGSANQSGYSQASSTGPSGFELPRAMSVHNEPLRPPYVSVPDASSTWRAQYRGGTSGTGIHDLARPRILDITQSYRDGTGVTGSPDAAQVDGVTPRSSSAFNRASRTREFDPARDLSPRPHQLPILETPPRRLSPNSAAQASKLADGCTLVDSIYDEADSAASSPRFLHEPEIPESVEAVVWRLFWQTLHWAWPILMKHMLPSVDGQPRVDKTKHPYLYNAVCSSAVPAWSTESDGPLPTLARRRGGTPAPISATEISDIYHQRAQYYLLRAGEEATMEKTQAHFWLALRGQGVGRSTELAQHSATSVRMAFDLGLHRDVQTLHGRTLSKADIQARHRLWWAIFQLDKLNALSLGRPCLAKSAECDAPRPIVDAADDVHNVATAQMMATNRARLPVVDRPKLSDSQMTLFMYSLDLSLIVEQIIAQYTTLSGRARQHPRCEIAPASSESWDVGLLRLHNAMLYFIDNQPEELKMRNPGPTPAHAIGSNVWNQAMLIMMHRPFILKQSTNPALPSSHTVCTESAAKLCALVKLCRSEIGIRALNATIAFCVFTAATVLLANTTSSDPTVVVEAKRMLAESADNLSVMSATWGSAKVHLDILRHLGQSLDADLVGTGLERRLSTETASEPPRKSSMGSAAAETEGSQTMTTPAQSEVQSAGRPEINQTQEALQPLLPYLPSDQYGMPPGHIHSQAGQEQAAGVPDLDAGGGGGGGIDLFGRPVSVAVPGSLTSTSSFSNARCSISDDRFFAINDENYWGQMPLATDDFDAWAAFVSQYLKTLNSASASSVTRSP